jgi:1-acyl-sn-glycerol-3-phosphate acyltransferase
MEYESPGLAGGSETEPRCHATTRSGEPCRNHPLPGQLYCHVHAAQAAEAPEELPIGGAPGVGSALPLATDAPAPADPRSDAVEEIPIANETRDDLLAEIAAEVQELELEVRNQTAAADTRARDMAASALRLIRENLPRMAPEGVQRVIAMVRENISSDYLDPDFWRGISMVLRYQVEEAAGIIQRRMRGEYATDDFGMDAELVELVRPFSTFMYRTYWRAASSGLENVPDAGPALLLANHGGVLPWDSMMIATAVLEEHSSPRVVRSLYPPAFRALPGVTSALATFGQAPDTPETLERLLGDGELVCAFPEGVSALGKLFRSRYKLQRFRRNGSVGFAIRAGAPIVPVAVVGSEETYPVLADASPLAQMLRLPFFPLTPLFPWLGPLGLLPLPSRWSITFGAPIDTSAYGPADADNPQVLATLAAQVREQLQGMLDGQVAARPSVF